MSKPSFAASLAFSAKALLAFSLCMIVFATNEAVAIEDFAQCYNSQRQLISSTTEVGVECLYPSLCAAEYACEASAEGRLKVVSCYYGNCGGNVDVCTRCPTGPGILVVCSIRTEYASSDTTCSGTPTLGPEAKMTSATDRCW